MLLLLLCCLPQCWQQAQREQEVCQVVGLHVHLKPVPGLTPANCRASSKEPDAAGWLCCEQPCNKGFVMHQGSCHDGVRLLKH